MLGAAMVLCRVAQAAQGGNKDNAQCRAEANKTLQHPGFKPSDYNFHGGTGVTTLTPSRLPLVPTCSVLRW
jgi:hypothetical protein